MKKTSLLQCFLFVFQSGLFCQEPAPNNFIIGIYGSHKWTSDPTGEPLTAPGNGSNYSSWFGVLAEDGFNTIFNFFPENETSFGGLKKYITLVKNNGMKSVVYNHYFFKVQPDGTGVNEYNLPRRLHSSRAAYNTDSCYRKVYSDTSVSASIYGIHLGGEFCYAHGYPAAHVEPPAYSWCDNCNTEYWKMAEVPPDKVSEAVSYFSSLRNSLNLNHQKLICNMARHGGFVRDNAPVPGHDYRPDQYINTTGARTELFDEGSYFSSQFRDWHKQDGSDPGYYYLGKFLSIDYARKYFNKVFAEVAIDQNDDKPDAWHYIYEIHSNPSVPNANALWFQSYTSVIHGAMGVVFYDLGYDYKISDPEELFNKKYAENEANPDRFDRQYFPGLYKRYVSNLSKELRYLVNQGLLTDDPVSVVMGKTTGADTNLILGPSEEYLLPELSCANLRDWHEIRKRDDPRYIYDTAAFTLNPFRGEDHGIRYTVRTNGAVTVLIACNPNPYTVRDVPFDFSSTTDPVIRNSGAAEVLFDDNGADPGSAGYKCDRSGGVDKTMTTVLKKYPKPLASGKCSFDFGPFDVRVIQFGPACDQWFDETIGRNAGRLQPNSEIMADASGNKVFITGSDGAIRVVYRDADKTWKSGHIGQNAPALFQGTGLGMDWKKNVLYYASSENRMIYRMPCSGDRQAECIGNSADKVRSGSRIIYRLGNVFYVGEDGLIRIIYRSRGKWVTQRLSNNARVRQGTGMAMGPGADFPVYYQGDDGFLYKIRWNNGWVRTAVFNTPLEIQQNSELHYGNGKLFYAGTDGMIRELSWRGSRRELRPLNEEAPKVMAETDFAISGEGGTITVCYLGEDGYPYRFDRDSTNSWQAARLSPSDIIKAGAGADVSFGKGMIFYEGSDQWLHGLSYRSCKVRE